MKTSYLLTGLVIVVLVVGGVLLLSGNKSNTAPVVTQQATSTQVQASTSVQSNTSNSVSQPAAPKTVTVTYNRSSFSPSTVTINRGDTVTFVDSSSDPMLVASNVHPSHTQYDGTAMMEHCAPGYAGPAPFDECKASTGNFSFTFTKVGTWSFHNHLNAGATGKIVVQ